jgi:hypothetical protein
MPLCECARPGRQTSVELVPAPVGRDRRLEKPLRMGAEKGGAR